MHLKVDWENFGPQKYISGRLMRKGEFMDTKVSFRGYMAWNYDREEQDLDRMSEQGWQLIKGGCFFSIYTRQPGILYRHRRKDVIWSCLRNRAGSSWGKPSMGGFT